MAIHSLNDFSVRQTNRKTDRHMDRPQYTNNFLNS